MAPYVSRVMLVVLVAGSAAGVTRAAQQTATWNNPAGGGWNTALNWNPAVVPNNGVPAGDTYRVFIALAGAPPGTAYTVNLDVDVTIDELNLTSDDATLAFGVSRTLSVLNDFIFTDADVSGAAGGSFSVGGVSSFTNARLTNVPTVNFGSASTLNSTSRIDGGSLITTPDGSTFTLNGATIMGAAQFTGGVGATITFNGAHLMGVGTLRNRGDLIFAGTCEEICDSGIDTSGQLIWSGPDVAFNGDSTITNRPGAVIDFRSDGTFGRTMAGGTQRIVNEGTLRRTTGAATATVNDVEIANTGTIEAASGTLLIGGANGSLINDEIVRSASGATLAIGSGTTFTNNDRVELAATSQFNIDAAADFTNFNAGTLTDGTYIVAGTLRFGTADLTTIQDAVVCLDGAASDIRRADDSMGIEDSLTAIAGTTKLELLGGRDYVNASDFAVGNDATLKTGTGSDFQVQTGSQLTNFNAGTLAQGTFDLKGNLQFDTGGMGIDTIDAKVILDGPASDITDFTRASLLGAFDTLANAGEFTIRNGRNFTTGGDFTINSTGVLNIENSGIFEVPTGFMLTNFDSGGPGVFENGSFNINGTLRAPNAAVVTLRNNVVIRGGGSGIINSTTGNDALATLSLIDTTGCLTVLDGATLTLDQPLTVLGKLIIGAPPARLDEGNLRVRGDLSLTQTGAVLDFQGGRIDLAGSFTLGAGAAVTGSGSINVGVTIPPPTGGGEEGSFQPITRGAAPIIQLGGTVSPGNDDDSTSELAFNGGMHVADGAMFVVDLRSAAVGDFDRVVINGDLIFGDGTGAAAGTLLFRQKPGFVATPGQVFEVLRYSGAAGSFAFFDGLDLGDGMFLSPVVSPGGLSVVVVPTPGMGLTMGLLAAFSARRRR